MFDPAMTDRMVHLSLNDSRVFVMPYDESQPFLMPQFPSSRLVWLCHLADTFHARHHRCLCLALILNMSTRRWGMPQVPTQTCGVEGVRWSWLADDFTDRSPGVLVGGSFQSAVLQGIHEAISLVPPTDGIHLVHALGKPGGMHAFMHVDGQTHAIDARKFVFDDVAVTLSEYAERLTLE